MARAYQLGAKTLDALRTIGEEVGWIFYRGPGHLSRIGMGRDDFYALRHAYAERDKRIQLAHMKRQKLIESRKIGNRIEVKITEKGFQSLLFDALRRAAVSKNGDEYCIIVFDIPESERARRDLMRYLFRECGLQCLQKSVWIAPLAVLPILQEFVKREKLTSWIHIIRGKIVTEREVQKFKPPRRIRLS